MSTFRKEKPENQTPEEIAKAEKAKAAMKAQLDIQMQRLEKEFMNIENKVKGYVITDENEVVNKATQFLK